MLTIGCDWHPSYEEIAMLDTTTGEIVRRRLEHENGEARAFYASLPSPAIVGVEATGCTQWFEYLLAELGHPCWIGDLAEIRARAVRRPKTDQRDADHVLSLLLTDRFPRLWVPSPQERDLRQLLKHRDERVQIQTSLKNQLHFQAKSQGMCSKKKVWSAAPRARFTSLEMAPLAPVPARGLGSVA